MACWLVGRALSGGTEAGYQNESWYTSWNRDAHSVEDSGSSMEVVSAPDLGTELELVILYSESDR